MTARPVALRGLRGALRAYISHDERAFCSRSRSYFIYTALAPTKWHGRRNSQHTDNKAGTLYLEFGRSHACASSEACLFWRKVGRQGVTLRGAGLEESPYCYKRLPDVLDEHEGTLRVKHVLHPLGLAIRTGTEARQSLPVESARLEGSSLA